jgi:hypothetical protein
MRCERLDRRHSRLMRGGPLVRRACRPSSGRYAFDRERPVLALVVREPALYEPANDRRGRHAFSTGDDDHPPHVVGGKTYRPTHGFYVSNSGRHPLLGRKLLVKQKTNTLTKKADTFLQFVVAVIVVSVLNAFY